MSKDRLSKIGDAAFSRMEKVHSELFSLTYGSLVTQLLKDMDNMDEVNIQLEKMGYNIGLRLIDEFLAKSSITQCASFKETAEVIAKVGFRMFLGIQAETGNWGHDNQSCSIIFKDNPLSEFVMLPPTLNDLNYNEIYCGVLRGCLEQLQIKAQCKIVRDTLKKDEYNEIRIVLKGVLKEVLHEDED